MKKILTTISSLISLLVLFEFVNITFFLIKKTSIKNFTLFKKKLLFYINYNILFASQYLLWRVMMKSFRFYFPCFLLLVSSFFLSGCDTVTLHALGSNPIPVLHEPRTEKTKFPVR
jgi:hypothetical protein